jgi:hypothetical protein
MKRVKKISLTVTLTPETMEYLERKVASKEFASFAHGVELCVTKYKEAEDRGERL